MYPLEQSLQPEVFPRSVAVVVGHCDHLRDGHHLPNGQDRGAGSIQVFCHDPSLFDIIFYSIEFKMFNCIQLYFDLN